MASSSTAGLLPYKATVLSLYSVPSHNTHVLTPGKSSFLRFSFLAPRPVQIIMVRASYLPFLVITSL